MFNSCLKEPGQLTRVDNDQAAVRLNLNEVRILSSADTRDTMRATSSRQVAVGTVLEQGGRHASRIEPAPNSREVPRTKQFTLQTDSKEGRRFELSQRQQIYRSDVTNRRVLWRILFQLVRRLLGRRVTLLANTRFNSILWNWRID
jgi:hypothetical protein